MQIEEFLEESADLLQWLDEADTSLHTKDPSAADEDSLVELVEKIKVCMTAVILLHSAPTPPPPTNKKENMTAKALKVCMIKYRLY